MLIECERLTVEDLESWRALERVDEINARRLKHKLELKSAKAAADVRSFLSHGAGYAGVSWGKDSVCLAHVLASHGVSVPLVWVRVDLVENPDCPSVRDAFLKRWPLDYHEISADSGKRRTSAEGFAEAARRFGRRHISGVRGQEAAYRMMRMRKHGVSSKNTCAPIGWWTTEEVFAYLWLHDLPVHPAYAMSYGGLLEREHQRVGAIGGERGRGFGRREKETRYYPDVLRSAGKTEA